MTRGYEGRSEKQIRGRYKKATIKSVLLYYHKSYSTFNQKYQNNHQKIHLEQLLRRNISLPPYFANTTTAKC